MRRTILVLTVLLIPSLVFAHGNKIGPDIRTSIPHSSCSFPSTTVIRTEWKAEYQVVQDLDGNDKIPRKVNNHWHFWTEYDSVGPGGSGYDSYCNSYTTERQCTTVREKKLRLTCSTADDDDAETCRNLGSILYDTSTVLGDFVFYYDYEKKERCRDVRVLIYP